ncbi:MAG TPA: PDDEXK nuclease domain-containing protein [Puia sp.]|nr:PDDEXK nuclease domain-containing protein [Puia sp.]
MEKQYIEFIADLKKNIIQSRYIAARLANKEQLMLYLQTGRMLSEKITAENWGSKIVEQIASDLQLQLPGLRGFSYRNLMKMKQFFEEYQASPFLPSPTAELALPHICRPEQFWSITFSHHIMLLNKCKTLEERSFYIHHAATNFWSVNLLEHHIDADLYKHQGKLPNNFDKTLPTLKPSALQVFRDEYLMDFIGSADAEDERILEEKVVADIKNFILRMGTGFCFLGNQFRLEVAGEEFFIDLLFFNRHLQCLVAFELKRGKFKPEYAGQLNFYLNVLDDKIKLPHENPSIGIVLCKEKTNTIVEFSIRNIDKAMGVATYRTTKEVPKEMKGILPDTAELVKLL